MKLIKVGSAYLNMDLVTDVWVDRGRVTVFFAVPAMYSSTPFSGVSNAVSTREVRFSGAQAAALMAWLAEAAQDITADLDDADDAVIGGSATDVGLTDYETVDDGPSS